MAAAVYNAINSRGGKFAPMMPQVQSAATKLIDVWLHFSTSKPGNRHNSISIEILFNINILLYITIDENIILLINTVSNKIK